MTFSSMSVIVQAASRRPLNDLFSIFLIFYAVACLSVCAFSSSVVVWIRISFLGCSEVSQRKNELFRSTVDPQG